ncbi:hypothetical protein P8452_14365 [Trifolium repens]|nr:hypothetical protein P8452_14360 [Trifolium repens]WJX25309.1 hypothetical protein P8452_14365 [Trifolium repens]
MRSIRTIYRQNLMSMMASTNTIYLPENQESNDGRKYTRGDMYGPSHKRSNGSFVNAEAQKKSVSDMDAPTRG